MTTFLLYDLKVALLITVFYMFYRLLAARETFHRLNRMVLLASLMLSLLLPLCVVTVHRTVEVSSLPQATVGMAEVGEVLEDGGFGLPGTVLALVYLLGVAFCLARTLINIWSVRRLIARCREVAVPSYVHDDIGGMRLFVAEDEGIKPFSWMRSVVLSRRDYEQDLADGARGRSIVLAHECGHVACRHSVDMLFVDMIVALQWFNPVVWLLRQDLRTVHEYEADARVLSQGFNAYQYLNLLIHKAAGDAGYSIANGISMSSVLSKRVKMMVKNKSPRYSWAKLLYVVPIVAISLAATAKTVVEYKVKESPKEENSAVVNKSEDAKPTLAENNPVIVAAPAGEAQSDDKEKAFDIVEVMPKFPGGDAKMLEFLSQNVKYPKDAQEKGLQGRVIVGFIVEKDGTISNAKVVSSNRYAEVEIKKDGTVVKKLEKTQESAGSTLEAEALRVVQSMPKWTPGKQKGKPVRVKFNIPIMFRLQ